MKLRMNPENQVKIIRYNIGQNSMDIIYLYLLGYFIYILNSI